MSRVGFFGPPARRAEIVEWEVIREDMLEATQIMELPTHIELEKMVAAFGRGEGVDPCARTRTDDFEELGLPLRWLTARHRRDEATHAAYVARQEAEREAWIHQTLAQAEQRRQERNLARKEAELAREAEEDRRLLEQGTPRQWFDELQYLRERHSIRGPLPLERAERIERLDALNDALEHYSGLMSASEKTMYELERRLLTALVR